MARATKSKAFGAELLRFKHAADVMDANAGDFPGFKGDIKALKDGVAALEKLNQEQEDLKAQLRQKTEELNNRRAMTRHVYGSLKRAWQAKYGTNTAKAKEFDLEEGVIAHRNTSPEQ